MRVRLSLHHRLQQGCRTPVRGAHVVVAGADAELEARWAQGEKVVILPAHCHRLPTRAAGRRDIHLDIVLEATVGEAKRRDQARIGREQGDVFHIFIEDRLERPGDGG